jgi:hypothetical protein
VYASNMQWPRANPGGIDSTGRYLFFPRKFFGNNTDDRNLGFQYDPPNLADPFDYRTRCHEFGHYALGFMDEYLFADSTGVYRTGVGRCLDIQDADYGFMDYQFPNSTSPHSSEMSSAARYASLTCRNNAQWLVRGMSCFDYLKARFQYQDTAKGVLVPIVLPSDRTLPSGLDYLPGPNDSLLNNKLDYDVGALVQFPVAHVAPVATTLTIFVSDSSTGAALSAADVSLKHVDGSILAEGQTASSGGMRVLGYLPTDTIVCSGRVAKVGAALASVSPEIWETGRMNPGATSTFFLGLQPVSGDFPLVCSVGVDSTLVSYSMSALAPFASTPSITWEPDTGAVQSTPFTSVVGGYNAMLTGDIGAKGRFVVHAVDSAARPFFFSTPYTVSHLGGESFERVAFGPQGQCEVRIDSANASIDRILIVSSPYLPIRAGLDPGALQGGNTYSVSAVPQSGMNGTNQITIRYSDDNLLSAGGDPLESLLQLYRWNSVSGQWVLMGGTVDTSKNEITGTITEAGVYAAFTKQTATGIGDHERGSLLPEQFELNQNYPNPFNPSTTIRYALPSRSHVTLAIYNLLGQEVVRLVDENQASGWHTVIWDGRNSSGQLVASGVYFYKLTTDMFGASRKMLLLK